MQHYHDLMSAKLSSQFKEHKTFGVSIQCRYLSLLSVRSPQKIFSSFAYEAKCSSQHDFATTVIIANFQIFQTMSPKFMEASNKVRLSIHDELLFVVKFQAVGV